MPRKPSKVTRVAMLFAYADWTGHGSQLNTEAEVWSVLYGFQRQKYIAMAKAAIREIERK